MKSDDGFLEGSPVETKSGMRTHRGYSLLNQPVNVFNFDDEVNPSASGRSKKVTAKKSISKGTTTFVLRKPGTELECPDL